MPQAVPLETTVTDVSARLAGPKKPLLIDVREDWEWEIAHIAGARLMPMGSLPEAVGELPRDADIVLYCHSGNRSRSAALWMRSEGFQRVQSMAGGVKAWGREIDPDMPQY